VSAPNPFIFTSEFTRENPLQNLTLRDLFAACAVMGHARTVTADESRLLAPVAYAIADALLAERAKERQ
jgi:hypothetical protein